MRALDWIVLASSLVFIVTYGVWKGRGSKDVRGFLLSNRDMKWYTIALSVMATQASAITFLSTPGQAYVDGMRFVQFYFGLPIAMVILCITAIPIYHKLNVFTAYQYLEERFDYKTRALTAFLFLTQRGLAAGLTIYAPSIILSTLFGFDLTITNILIGGLVIIYTTSGGTKAVSWTQFHQVFIILAGMVGAGVVMFSLLPEDITFWDSLFIAGKSGKLNAIDFSFDLNDRYTIWSGIIGGLFLQLSYFGTDQSQVQRYLTGESVTQSRLGLIFNGMAKVPMQFVILFLGASLFVFYQFVTPPIFFDPVSADKARSGQFASEFLAQESAFRSLHEARSSALQQMVHAKRNGDKRGMEKSSESATALSDEMQSVRKDAIAVIQRTDSGANTNDTNYIFLTFVISFLPAGLVGLVLAAIFAASMSSTSSEINALASTSVIDVYKRVVKHDAREKHYLRVSRLATVFWGCFAVGFAEFANQLGSLIEAVNILGSLFYGTILGVFLTGFYLKRIGGSAVFFAALIAETAVILCYLFTDISFLWYNVIGCVLVALIASVLQSFIAKRRTYSS